MANKRKLLEKFLHNPAGVHYRDLEQILNYLGFEKVPAKGSHIKFKHPVDKRDLIIPVHGNDCKAFYKQLAAKIIKNL
jgi:predicted RNA binding protein YcfA (HicA-like mRNA interferase family)